MLILSLLLLKTQEFEEIESQVCEQEATRLVDKITHVETMKNFEVKKCVELIKNYKFVSYATMYGELFFLCLICTFSANILILPYLMIAIVLCLVMALSKKQRYLCKASNKLNLIIIALLLVDLLTKYMVRAIAALSHSESLIFYREVVGLLSSVPTYIDFYLKLFLLHLEGHKLSYTFDYQTIYEQIKIVHQDKPRLKQYFQKKLSLTKRILRPISLFMFCTISLVFSLYHPSLLLLFCMPLFIWGYFKTNTDYPLANFFCVMFGVYILFEYVYNVFYVLWAERRDIEIWNVYMDRLFAFQQNFNIFEDVFPFNVDFLLFILLTLFAVFIRKAGMGEEILSNEKITFFQDFYQMVEDDATSEVKSLHRRAATSVRQRPHTALNDDLENESLQEIDDETRSFKSQAIESRSGNNLVSKAYQQQQQAWHQQQDESLRGKFTKFMYKVYESIMKIVLMLRDLIILHWMKLCLFALFCVSVSRPTLFNLIFFIIFLILTLSSVTFNRKMWNISVIYNSLVIMSLYTYDVFWESEKYDLVDPVVLELVGIITNPQNNEYMKKYVNYLILLLVQILNHYIIYSQKYEEIIEYYKAQTSLQKNLEIQSNAEKNLEQLDEGSQSQEENRLLKEEQKESENSPDQNSLKKNEKGEEGPKKEEPKAEEEYPFYKDYLSKLLIKNAIFLLMLALFLEALLIPVTFISLALQVLMSVVIHKYLFSKNQIEMYSTLGVTLQILKYVALVFACIKFIFQFHEYVQYFDEKAGRHFYDNSATARQIIGIDNNYMALKIFSLSLIMVLSHNQLKFLEIPFIFKILEESDANWDRYYFLQVDNQTKFKTFWHHFSVYSLFILYHLFILLPIVMVIIISLCELSIIGCLFLITTIILMYVQRDTFWENSYQVISVVNSVAIILVFIAQIVWLNIREDSHALDWLGLYKVGDPTSKHPLIFKQFAVLSAVYLACIIQKISQQYKELFVQTIKKEDIGLESQSSLALSSQEEDALSSSNNSELRIDEIQSKEDKIQSDSESKKNESPKIGGEHDIILKQAVYKFEKPIRNCLRVRDQYMRVYFYTYGIIFFVFLSLIVMLYKLNVTSILFSVVFVVILKQDYYPLRFRETQEQTVKRIRVSYLLKFQIAIISFTIIEEYVLLYGSEYLPQFLNWKEKFSAQLCFERTEDCINEWNEWLSLSDFSFTYIGVDYIYLLVCYLNLMYTQGHIQLLDSQYKENPQVNDSKDFVSGGSYKKRYAMFLYSVFYGFPVFFLFYLFIVATSFHVRGMTDMIQVVYLFFAFYYFLFFNKLYTRNTKLLNPLRLYNLIVLFSILLFQIPIFVCPTGTHDGYRYINKEECRQLFEAEKMREQYHGDKSYGELYLVLTSSIGLYKSYKNIQFPFILLFLFSEIQNHIFYHPFFKVYVLQHLYSEKETDGRLRGFMYVERSHLSKLWSYKSIKEEIKILHHKLMRINKFMRNFQIMREARAGVIRGDTDDYGIHSGEEDNSPDKTNLLQADQKNDEQNEGIVAIEGEQKQKEGKTQEEEELDKVFEAHYAEIENIALEMIERPDQPVIPLKQFMEACKQEFIHEELENKKKEKEGEKKSQEEEIANVSEKLLKIVLRLQKEVHYQNRMNLYQKEGIGLHCAIKNGSADYLKESNYNFYHHLVFGTLPQQEEERLKLEAEQKLQKDPPQKSSLLQEPAADENEEDHLIELEEKPKPQKKKEFLESYEENLLIYQKYKDTDLESKSFFEKVNFHIRTTLFTEFIDKLILISFTNKRHQIKLERISLIKLFLYALLSQSQKICVFFMFVNFIFNTNILSMVLPLTTLLYAMIDHPVPKLGYWKFIIIYQFIVIAAKFIYQFPIFCSTPPYTLYNAETCTDTVIQAEVLVTRIDYLIGIHKFAGPASYPRDKGTLHGIFTDLLVLFSVLLYKNFLKKIGVWHYVRVNNNIYENPSFKCKQSEMTENEQLDLIRKENVRIYNYDSQMWPMKFKFKVEQSVKWIKEFSFKILPMYMNKKQRNLDVRNLKECPSIQHKFVKVKPGKNYFTQTFFTLLILLFYFLFFYKNVVGYTQSGALSDVKLSRFTSAQVLLLFFILTLMVVERMLFRSRLYISKTSKVSPGFLIQNALTIKTILHFLLVIIVHLFYGFYYPHKNHRSMRNCFALVVGYIFWVIYFIFSALQIRDGFPQRPFKPHFTKDTSPLNVNAFRIYKAIPFLWEMKVIIDWTVTKTSLDLYQWFKIDDAFNYLFYVRYQNAGRTEIGEYDQQPFIQKFCMGFCFAILIIIIIIGPILLFAEPIMIQNPVQSAYFSLGLEMNSNGNQYNIFDTQGINIKQLEKKDVDYLEKNFTPYSLQFESESMQKMSFSPYSENLWTISPPALEKFISDYYAYSQNPNSYIDFIVQFEFERDNPVGSKTAEISNLVRMNVSVIQPIIDTLENGNSKDYDIEQNTINVTHFLPKLFRLGSTSEGEMLAVNQISGMHQMTSLNLTLHNANNKQFYWTFSIDSNDRAGVFNSSYGSASYYQNTDNDLVVVVFNEEVVANWLGQAASTISVVGLYATVVVAIGGWIRLIFDRISQRIIYEEMPDPEKLFEICEGIFIAQLEGDLVKEKRLYNLLIKIYRSPETIILMTGTKLKYDKKRSRND